MLVETRFGGLILCLGITGIGELDSVAVIETGAGERSLVVLVKSGDPIALFLECIGQFQLESQILGLKRESLAEFGDGGIRIA